MFAVAKLKKMPPRKKTAPEAIAFGDAVRKRRRVRGWTQEQLAERAGVAAIHVGFVERGENVPKLTLSLRIAKALGVRPGELIDHSKVR